MYAHFKFSFAHFYKNIKIKKLLTKQFGGRNFTLQLWTNSIEIALIDIFSFAHFQISHFFTFLVKRLLTIKVSKTSVDKFEAWIQRFKITPIDKFAHNGLNWLNLPLFCRFSRFPLLEMDHCKYLIISRRVKNKQVNHSIFINVERYLTSL